MFWTVFYALCTQNGEKPNNVAQKLNISSGVVTKWKNGSNPSFCVNSNTAAMQFSHICGISKLPEILNQD